MASLPSNWREALGGELTAAQQWAEFVLVRQALGVFLPDWLRARTMDRLDLEIEKWQTLSNSDWIALADQLADEAAAELQNRSRLER